MHNPRPAILIAKKRHERTRHMYFEDHSDALDTALTMAADGWRYEMFVPEVYTAGEKPIVDANAPRQMELGEYVLGEEQP